MTPLASPTYTLVLRSTSYLVDASTRQQVLNALQNGATSITIRTLSRCACDCSGDLRRERVALEEVTGFLQHEAKASLQLVSRLY
jgi:hypothetical protein